MQSIMKHARSRIYAVSDKRIDICSPRIALGKYSVYGLDKIKINSKDVIHTYPYL